MVEFLPERGGKEGGFKMESRRPMNPMQSFLDVSVSGSLSTRWFKKIFSSGISLLNSEKMENIKIVN